MRTSSRNGQPSRNTGAFHNWQAYCSDAAFDHYGDGFVIHSCEEDGSVTHNHSRGGATAVGVNTMLCAVPLHDPTGGCGPGGKAFEPCGRASVLRFPLPPCARGHLGHRVTPVSYGERFEWWRSCSTACEPLPNAIRINRTGSVSPLHILPSIDGRTDRTQKLEMGESNGAGELVS